MKELTKHDMLRIEGGITIEQYAQVVKWLQANNPDQLEAVLSMFDAGQIQFEV